MHIINQMPPNDVHISLVLPKDAPISLMLPKNALINLVLLKDVQQVLISYITPARHTTPYITIFPQSILIILNKHLIFYISSVKTNTSAHYSSINHTRHQSSYLNLHISQLLLSLVKSIQSISHHI